MSTAALTKQQYKSSCARWVQLQRQTTTEGSRWKVSTTSPIKQWCNSTGKRCVQQHRQNSPGVKVRTTAPVKQRCYHPTAKQVQEHDINLVESTKTKAAKFNSVISNHIHTLFPPNPPTPPSSLSSYICLINVIFNCPLFLAPSTWIYNASLSISSMTFPSISLYHCTK